MVIVRQLPKYATDYYKNENKTFLDELYFHILTQANMNLDVSINEIYRILSILNTNESRIEYLKKEKEKFLTAIQNYPAFNGYELVEDETLLKEKVEDLIYKSTGLYCSDYKCKHMREYVKIDESKRHFLYSVFDHEDYNNKLSKAEKAQGIYILRDKELVVIESTGDLVTNKPVLDFISYYSNMILFRKLEREENEYRNPVTEKETLTGYKTTWNQAQITNLYHSSKDYIKTDLQNLINLLNEKDCKPIIWNSSKVKLRAFIVAVFENPTEPRTISKKYFRNNEKNTIYLSNPVNTDMNYENYIETFQKLLK